MKITRLQQSLLIISVSIPLTFFIQLKSHVFSRARAINVTRVIPEVLVTAGNKKYFTDEHTEQALLRIKNTTILDNLLITITTVMQLHRYLYLLPYLRLL